MNVFPQLVGRTENDKLFQTELETNAKSSQACHGPQVVTRRTLLATGLMGWVARGSRRSCRLEALEAAGSLLSERRKQRGVRPCCQDEAPQAFRGAGLVQGHRLFCPLRPPGCGQLSGLPQGTQVCGGGGPGPGMLAPVMVFPVAAKEAGPPGEEGAPAWHLSPALIEQRRGSLGLGLSRGSLATEGK